MSTDATTEPAAERADGAGAPARKMETDETAGAPAPEAAPPTGGGGRLMRMAVAGVVGAATVTALNEAARRLVPHAPRMEVIGERAVSRTMRAVSLDPPRGRALYRWTLVGDLASNALYYGLAGAGPRRGALPRGVALGMAAGLGAAFLPRPLGLGRQPGERAPRTQALTVAWYLAAGLAAAASRLLLPGR